MSDVQKHLRLLGLLVLVVSLGVGCESDAVAPQASVEAFADHLDDRVPALLDHYDVPGASIALVRRGKLAWTGAYGKAAPEQDRPATTETLFRVQSITKSVTAWGVMRLVETGKIGLDEPVLRYIDDWEPPDANSRWAEVTVRRLLSHSAGLPAGAYVNVGPDEEMPSLETALSGAAGAPAVNPIGEPGSFRYSNPGYALLELVVEDVTGRDFAAYMESEVLGPLGMVDATFSWNEQVRSALATEHRVDGDPVPLYREPANAHGMLSATAADIGRLIAAGMREPQSAEPGSSVLESGSVQALYTSVVETAGFYRLGADSAALGHFVESLPDGRRAVLNGGQGTGSWSWLHSVPETGDGIVVLTNSERSLQLITRVVDAWTNWCGLASTRLARSMRWAKALVWALWGIAGGVSLWLGYGVVTGHRSFDPLATRNRAWRAAAVVLAAAILAGWWGMGRAIVGYVLPVLSTQLGRALSAVALLMVLVVLLPRKGSEAA